MTTKTTAIAVLLNAVILAALIAMHVTRGAVLGLSAAVLFVTCIGWLIYASKLPPQK